MYVMEQRKCQPDSSGRPFHYWYFAVLHAINASVIWPTGDLLPSWLNVVRSTGSSWQPAGRWCWHVWWSAGSATNTLAKRACRTSSSAVTANSLAGYLTNKLQQEDEVTSKRLQKNINIFFHLFIYFLIIFSCLLSYELSMQTKIPLSKWTT